MFYLIDRLFHVSLHQIRSQSELFFSNLRFLTRPASRVKAAIFSSSLMNRIIKFLRVNISRSVGFKKPLGAFLWEKYSLPSLRLTLNVTRSSSLKNSPSYSSSRSGLSLTGWKDWKILGGSLSCKTSLFLFFQS